MRAECAPEAAAPIAEWIRSVVGIDVELVDAAALSDSIDRRMRALVVDSPARYLELLRDDRDDAAGGLELEALIDELGLGETWFFRDVEPFRRVRSHAEAWRARGERPPLRVLSAPCATGEEPYSVAMVLLDAGFAASELVIDAIDLRRSALAVATRGAYNASSFRGEELVARERYFQAVDGRFVLGDEVRSVVRFRHGNLLDLDELGADAPYDIILCRNGMIYLSRAARARVVDAIDRRLAGDGILIAGHAESAVWGDRFESIEHAGAFALRRARVSPPAAARRDVPLDRAPAAPSLGATSAKSPLCASGLQKASSPASGDEATKDALSRARELADAGQLAESERLCNAHLERVPDDVEAHLLVAVIAAAGERVDDAARALDRALYLAPDHLDAMLHRSLLHERLGDREAAARLRERAARVRARSEEDR